MVTTIVHHHMHATTPMDEHTHIMSIENEKSQGEAKSMKTNQTKIRTAKSSSHDEEGGPTRFMGKNSEGALKVLVCCGVGISRNDVNLEVTHLLKHYSEEFSNCSRRIHCSLVVEMAYTAP